MKRLSDEEKAELQSKMAEARTGVRQPKKGTTRSWTLPALIIAAVIMLGVLAVIPQCLSGLYMPPRVNPSTRERFLVVAAIVAITTLLPALIAIWFLVKRWPEQQRTWFRRWRERRKRKTPENDNDV